MMLKMNNIQYFDNFTDFQKMMFELISQDLKSDSLPRIFISVKIT